MMHLFILWAILLGPLVTVKADSCYAQSSNPYVLFSTYTPYEFVHGNAEDPVYIPQCQPVQFWILSRHGTRYTDAIGINDMWSLICLRDEIITNIKNGRGRLCAQDVDNLKKWTPQVVQTLSMNLTPQGYKDAYNMAQRFKSRFPTLLNQSYSPDKFEVRFTNTQRTTLTSFAFIDGIFGSTAHVILPKPISDDPVLRPSNYCDDWKNVVRDNPDTTKEYSTFKKGPEMNVVIQSVSNRLGFTSSISYDNLSKMYTICRFEKAWHVDSVSPWCAAFSEDELKVLEYKEDLSAYYKHGYGSDLNKKVGCVLVKDFLDRFSKLENGENQPAGVFYFSHDTDMQLFLTSLGVAKDSETLTHSNYKSMENRLWRTSLLTPFAANFAAVFFKCDGGRFGVQFYLQEQLLRIDGCESDLGDLCDWAAIKKKYGSVSQNCDLSFC
ncbi:multiple inositol polyphosphate phosphatase 1-like [Cryptotermes secundus]|uniref:multiple inositol polyphosphate phosphatase 1-like n=1 Tax=Cryptotermes secundus TaxID=105785 RepID=UPI000CD7B9FF|nr:multiple inositol polyphosphate phosphatase 1-like [Cryptotermes secundus]